MKNTLLILVLVAVIFNFSACEKDRYFKMIVINDTECKLDELQFSCTVNEKDLVLEPHSTSSLFMLAENRGLHGIAKLFASPQMCVDVRRYTDTSGAHEHNWGSAFDLGRLMKKGTNTIKVTMASDTTHGRFDFELN